MILTYRYRVKNLHGLLNRQARAVNFVWNFCNDRQKDAVKWSRKWLTGYDLGRLTAGSSRELGLLASTIEKVCQRYADSRHRQKRASLRYRGKKSLGWVPLKLDCLTQRHDRLLIGGHWFRLFYSRPIPEGARVCEGSSFAQDACGNWFLNLVLELPDAEPRQTSRAVGIDLGLKDLAALSTGEKIANPRLTDRYAVRLATADRAGKKRRVRTIHAKIKNSRRDALHKLSFRLVQDFDFIAVGGVSASRLAKTSMAKSVKDASWTSFRTMLAYKAIGHGARYAEVDEAFSTQVCSECGSLGGPKGIADLGIRAWDCQHCGSVNDRDVNAARNILRRGHTALVEGVRV